MNEPYICDMQMENKAHDHAETLPNLCWAVLITIGSSKISLVELEHMLFIANAANRLELPISDGNMEDIEDTLEYLIGLGAVKGNAFQLSLTDYGLVLYNYAPEHVSGLYTPIIHVKTALSYATTYQLVVLSSFYYGFKGAADLKHVETCISRLKIWGTPISEFKKDDFEYALKLGLHMRITEER